MTTHLLNAALEAAARGWHVHPLRPGGKGSALHGERACPHTGVCASGHVKWEQRATTDPDRIRAAWSTGAAYNVGIATGPSRLLVVDLDIPKPQKGKSGSDAPDGAQSFRALCERAGQSWPTTHTVRTPSGGIHLYFTTPSGIRLPCTARTVAANVDTRAWGGNIVAAGSTTPTGTYTTVDNRPAVPLPDWLLHHLHTPPKPTVAAPAPLVVPGGTTRRAAVALDREAADVSATGEGGRNSRLLAGARAVGRFVAWGEIPRHVVEQAFQAAGEASGLPPTECRATVRSALDWSIRTARPRDAA